MNDNALADSARRIRMAAQEMEAESQVFLNPRRPEYATWARERYFKAASRVVSEARKIANEMGWRSANV